MKIKTLFVILLPLLLSMVVISFGNANLTETNTGKEWPANVKSAIDKSCYGCHNSVSGNQKAAEKLNFITLDSLSRVQKIAKFKAINETIKNGEMPPKKFLDKNPEKKLTAEEMKAITDWYSGEIKDLLKN